MVIGTLIEAAGDKDPAVRESAIASLRRVSKKYPSFVLKNAVGYRLQHRMVNILLLVQREFMKISGFQTFLTFSFVFVTENEKF